MNEPTDTYVWGAIVDNGLDPRDVLLWNIFPFHPHKTSPFSNRTPTDSELADGLVYAKALLSYCGRIYAWPPSAGSQQKPCRMPASRPSPCAIRPTAEPVFFGNSSHVFLDNSFKKSAKFDFYIKIVGVSAKTFRKIIASTSQIVYNHRYTTVYTSLLSHTVTARFCIPKGDYV